MQPLVEVPPQPRDELLIGQSYHQQSYRRLTGLVQQTGHKLKNSPPDGFLESVKYDKRKCIFLRDSND